MITRLLRTLAVAALATTAATAAQEIYFFTLGPEQEVPAPELGDAEPRGHALVVLDTETMEITWSINFEGLTGPAVGMHFHGPAGFGENNGVVVGIDELTPPVVGGATLTAEQMDLMQSGQLYLNVHTAANPPGEIRGQVVKAPGPVIPLSQALTPEAEPHNLELGDAMPSGQLVAGYDHTANALFWTFTWSGLTGPATMAHVHGPADTDESAGVVLPVSIEENPSHGVAFLDDGQEAALLAGLLYLNIHTEANPAGELRAQFVPSAGLAQAIRFPLQPEQTVNDLTLGEAMPSGTAWVVFDATTMVWNVMYEGLTGEPTMAHFHGPAGFFENAGVDLGIDMGPSPVVGSALPTPAQADNFRAGSWYLNIHTEANPAGEIRGQAVAEPIAYFRGGMDLGFGWFDLPAIGPTYAADFPWLIHPTLGAFYGGGTGGGDTWFYLPELGWLYATASTFPFAYSATTESWLWYQPGSTNPRVFYDFGTEQFIFLPGP